MLPAPSRPVRHCLILAILAGALPAVEISPGFTVGGWGEGFMEGSVDEANSPGHSREHNLGETDRDIAFRADALFFAQVRYDHFTLRTDIVVYDESPFLHEDGGELEPDAPILLEQAFIDWQAGDQVTLRGGRFRNTWLGWEAFHTPGLWRVKQSAAWDWNVQNHSLKPNQPFLSDGVGALFTTASRQSGAEFYVVEQILGSTDDRSGTDLGTGMSLWTRIPDVGRIELGIAHDPRSTNGPGGKGVHAFAIDLNADISGLEDRGWFFAFEAQYHSHDDLYVGPVRYGSDLVLLAMANYTFTPTMSGTVMVDWVERGFKADDNELVEVAVALLTRPHPKVRFNVELNAIRETADEADSFGAAAVVLVELP